MLPIGSVVFRLSGNRRSDGPASISATRRAGSALSRFATTQPAAPAPMMRVSKPVAVMATRQHAGAGAGRQSTGRHTSCDRRARFGPAFQGSAASPPMRPSATCTGQGFSSSNWRLLKG